MPFDGRVSAGVKKLRSIQLRKQTSEKRYIVEKKLSSTFTTERLQTGSKLGNVGNNKTMGENKMKEKRCIREASPKRSERSLNSSETPIHTMSFK